MGTKKSSIDKSENKLNQKIVALFDHIWGQFKSKVPSVNQSMFVEFLTSDPTSKNPVVAPSASDYFTGVRVKFNKPLRQDILLLKQRIKQEYPADVHLLEDCETLLGLVAERTAIKKELPDLTKSIRQLETCLNKFWNSEGDLEKLRSEISKRLDDIDFSNPAYNYSPILLLTIQRLEIPWHRHAEQKHNEAITLSIGKKMADTPDEHITEHGLKLLSIAGRAQYLLSANGKEGHILQRLIELKRKISVVFPIFPDLLTAETQFDDEHYVMNSTCPAEVRLHAFQRLSEIVNASEEHGYLRHQGLCCIACYLANNDRIPEAEIALAKLNRQLDKKVQMPDEIRHSVRFYSTMVQLKIMFDADRRDYGKIFNLIATAGEAITAYLKCKNLKEPLDPIVLALHCYYRAAVSPFVKQGETPSDALSRAKHHLSLASMGGCIKSKAWIQAAVDVELSKYPEQNY